jgi:lactoylglutathione lyase
LRAVACRRLLYPSSVPPAFDRMRYRLSYVGVQVREIERSIGFYRDLLGMQIVRRKRVSETGGEWVELRSPGSRELLELNWYPEGSKFFAGPYRNGDELDHIAFDCEDVASAYQELIAKGARAGHPPFAEGGSLLAYVQDPDGIWIELTGPLTSP